MLPKIGQIAATFVLVLIAWSFFRRKPSPIAISYLGSMLGLVEVLKSSLLFDDLLYPPYTFLAMAAAALVVWRMPQTRD